MKSWIGHYLNEIYKTSIALGANVDISDVTEQLTKAYCNRCSIDLDSEDAMLIRSAFSIVVQTTAIQRATNAFFKNAYTRAILNRAIDVVFEQQQNEIEKMLSTKNPFEGVVEKSNEKTLTELINDIMEKAKAAKSLIGES